MTLDQLLTIGRSFETSEREADLVEAGRQEATYAVSDRGRRDNYKQSYPNHHDHRHPSKQHPSPGQQSQPQRRQPQQGNRNCWFCGGPFPHKTTCPATGKECRHCKKMGHFASVCRSAKANEAIHTVDQDDDNSETDAGYVFANHASAFVIHSANLPTCQMNIGNTTMTAMIDSGASVNVLDSKSFNLLKQDHHSFQMRKPKSKVFSYGTATPLPVLGVFSADVTVGSTSCPADFHVVDTDTCNLLSYTTAKQLKLINLNTDHVTCNIQSAPERMMQKTEKTTGHENVFSQYTSLFDGIGKIKDVQIKLHIDPDVLPKQQKHRRIPFHTRKDVEKELQRLEDLDIIEKIDGPTPWVSPIVVVPKPSGAVRICVDMRQANKAIKRERHPMPTLEDIIADLNGASVFSTLDMTAGYHQFELAPEARHVTTFSTHVGLRRYKRLMFGVNAASEIFQTAVSQLLTGLAGCKNMSDDIIVYGKDKLEHDRNLKAVLDRLQSNNAKLNKDKCNFAQSKSASMGISSARMVSLLTQRRSMHP